jgi:hypothetical protein
MFAQCAGAEFNRPKTGFAAIYGAGSRSFTADVICAPRPRNGSRIQFGRPAATAALRPDAPAENGLACWHQRPFVVNAYLNIRGS